MKIVDFLPENLVLSDLRSSQKPEVLRELAAAIAVREPGVSSQELVRRLMEREQLGSTALGEDLAIPHAKLDSVPKLVACLGRSRRGIDFGAEDGRKTHFFFVLVAPKHSTGDHLKALARISRLFRHEGFRSRMKDADSSQDMHRIIDEADSASVR